MQNLLDGEIQRQHRVRSGPWLAKYVACVFVILSNTFFELLSS